MLYSSLILILVIGAVTCSPERVQNENDQNHEHDAHEEGHVAQLEKRSPHYDFGLGKRAYSYVSEYKRLPVYNFGLGKRSRPYSFGLGKRSVDEDTDEDFTNDIDQATQPEVFEYDEAPEYEVKRARPYSFGLGKRFVEDEEEEKRARMYDFGLGKRPHLYSFGLGKRARSYNFGLGKRLSSKFNFGLGKRQRDMHRFGFGLGKRSENSEDSEYFDV
ncbi:allatostatin-A [Pieris napi]|uniref:allatostatin-A n=1 Tax=Pieris napi TaxID=78633 RepID=UPI001FBA581A|nr:allatostatin-A [Pieris napi]XP_047516008.1 allatostatin-A [Pieris napi]